MTLLWTAAFVGVVGACGAGVPDEAGDDGGAADGGPVLDWDAGDHEVGDAARPDPPCGTPIRRVTARRLEGTNGRALRGWGDELFEAGVAGGTDLVVRRTALDDGSSRDYVARVPDEGRLVWALAFLPRPTVLLGTVSGEPADLLWAEVQDHGIEVTALALPHGVSFTDLPAPRAGWFASHPTGFLRLVTVGGEPHVLQVSAGGVDAVPVTLPAGSSLYGVGASELSETAVLAAHGFGEDPRVELASLGSAAAPAAGDWRRILDWEPLSLSLDLTSERVAVTAVREDQVQVVWLDAGLEERDRTRLPLDRIHSASVVGDHPRALVANRIFGGVIDGALLYGLLLGGDRVEGLRSLLDGEALPAPFGWERGEGRHVVVAPGRHLDVFLLCGGEP